MNAGWRQALLAPVSCGSCGVTFGLPDAAAGQPDADVVQTHVDTRGSPVTFPYPRIAQTRHRLGHWRLEASSAPFSVTYFGMTILIYIAAALAEIAGCFSFWAWLRLGKSTLWLVPGMLSLAFFAYLLTLAPSEAAGRAYAAYGGVYIASSLVWLWMVEGRQPDRWDFTGAAVCLAGAAIILFGPRNG